MAAAALALLAVPAAASAATHYADGDPYFKGEPCTPASVSLTLPKGAHDAEVIKPLVGRPLYYDGRRVATITDLTRAGRTLTWTAEDTAENCAAAREWYPDVEIHVAYRAPATPHPPSGLPRLTEKTAKFYATKAFKQDRRLKYRQAYDKRFSKCARVSRTRVHCVASFEVNPFHAFKGPISIWLSRNKQDGRIHYHWRYNLTHYDPACVKDGHSISYCTWP